MRLGGVQARYADSINASAGAVGLLASWEHDTWRAGADASFSRFAAGGSATQGNLSAAWVSPLGTRAAMGLQGAATGSALSSGLTAWTGTAQLFGAVTAPGWLAVGAVSAGGAHTIWSVTEGLYGGLLRVRRDAGPVSFEAAASGTWAGKLQFTDLTGAAEWVSADGRARLGGVAGTRLGSLSGKPLLQVHGELAVPGASGIVLEAAVGRYPEDLTGFTSGVFGNIGIRVPLNRSARRIAAPPRSMASSRSVVVEPGDSGRMRVTIAMPNAASVAIGGEWNQWNPVPMTRIDGTRWQVQLPLGRGAYRFAVEVDGGSWIVPPGVPKLPDGFGGDVGILVIGG